MASAIRSDDPVVFFEHKGLFASKGEPAPPDHVVPLGQARVAREGTDVTLVALASTVPMAWPRPSGSQSEGISAEVIDLRCLVPLDMATVLASVGAHLAAGRRRGEPVPGRLGRHRRLDRRRRGLRAARRPDPPGGGENVPLPFADALGAAVIPTVDKVVDAVTEVVAVLSRSAGGTGRRPRKGSAHEQDPPPGRNRPDHGPATSATCRAATC